MRFFRSLQEIFYLKLNQDLDISSRETARLSCKDFLLRYLLNSFIQELKINLRGGWEKRYHSILAPRLVDDFNGKKDSNRMKKWK